MKIPSIPPKTPTIQSTDAAQQAAESTAEVGRAANIQAAAPVSADPVAQIAQDVAMGKIGRKEAVDRILEDALGTPMLDAVPAEVRADLENALRVLIAEDPHLKSLCAAIGPSETK